MNLPERTPSPTVLVVEDDMDIRALVCAALRRADFAVREARTVAAANDALAQQRPDLLILDLGLPDGDGVALIHALRSWSALPVLVLSARNDERDKVHALDAGADDYLAKPFGVAELIARSHALLRRGSPDTAASVVCFADVRVDRAHRSVERGGAPLHLTPIEYRLLAVLLTHAGRVMTHQQLLRAVWGARSTDATHYLRIYVGHLRQKLEQDPTRPRHLLTETGVGYRFQLEQSNP